MCRSDYRTTTSESREELAWRDEHGRTAGPRLARPSAATPLEIETTRALPVG